MEMPNFFKRLANFDLTKVERGVGMFSNASTSFSYGGISFRFSKKVSDFIKDKVNKNDVKSVIYYEFSALMHNWLAGDWRESKKYDDNLSKLNLRIGEILYTTFYILQHCFLDIERGHFTGAQEVLHKDIEIADIYDHDHTRAGKYYLNTKILMKYRKLHDALIESETGIDLLNKSGQKMMPFSTYSFRVRIQIM